MPLTESWQTQLQEVVVNPPVQALLMPESLKDLEQGIQHCHHQQETILPCGSGSKLSWGQGIHQATWLLSVQKLNRVIEYTPADLTITVEAGRSLQALQAHLHDSRQFWPVDPLYAEQATVGGIIATGDSGSWRYRYGGVRDLVLGVTWVRADGHLAKAGGRVVKNVAGYDLMKLMTGSYGTLGILAQVTLRLYPLPKTQHSLLLAAPVSTLKSIRQRLVSSSLTPVAVDLLSTSLVKELGLGASAGLWVEFHGFVESIQAQMETLSILLQDLTYDRHLFPLDQRVLLAPYFEKTPLLLKIGILPAQTGAALDWIETYFPDNKTQIHAGNGLGRVSLPRESKPDQLQAFRHFLESHKGFLTILEAPLALKQTLDPWGLSGQVMPLMARLRHQFDPQQTLSPGRFG
jgi:glycolate oxidase FAD binding subunit